MNKVYTLIIKSINVFLTTLNTFVYKYSQRKSWKQRYKGKFENIELSKSEINEIKKYYKSNYGKNVPIFYWKIYKYIFGLDSFEVRKIPPELYISKIEKAFNNKKHYVDTFEDKNLVGLIAKEAMVKIPTTIVSCSNGIFKIKDSDKIVTKKEAIEYMRNMGECFIKPSIDSAQGENCFKINVVDGIEIVSREPIFEFIKKYNGNFVVQDIIKQYKDLEKLNPYSVNTLRIVSFILNEKVEHLPIILRMGVGDSCVDNICAGGIAIVVGDNGELSDTSHDRNHRTLKEHPTTKVSFKNYKINNVDKCIDAIERMHSVIPQVGYISWDMTIDSSGNPVLIEANMQECACWEYVVEGSCFGEFTEEILKKIK